MAPYASASRSARAALRLVIRSGPTPARVSVATDSAPIAPAPITSAGRPVEVAEVDGGDLERGGDDALPGLVDAGLGVRPLADPQRLLHQLVQQPAGGVGLGGRVVGVAELAEDLRLADDHRVEPGGHPERVPHGRLVVVHVEVAGQLGGRDAGLLGEHVADVAEAAVEAGDRRVDLDPVAGGEHHGLADVRLGDQLVQQAGHGRLRRW